jgi:hypothetical protein
LIYTVELKFFKLLDAHFFTLGFQIVAGIHAGALEGLFHLLLFPSEDVHLFVPRSLSEQPLIPTLAIISELCRLKSGLFRPSTST